MSLIAVLALGAVAVAPLVILGRCQWERTALGVAAVTVLIGIATAVAFAIVDDSATCDDVCEELYPLMLGAAAVTALDISAWALAFSRPCGGGWPDRSGPERADRGSGTVEKHYTSDIERGGVSRDLRCVNIPAWPLRISLDLPF
ncbi:hypothetical protein [Solirubrobacter pauli]|uniref:hypothetical protein n=1 Tax=Solirubrobacter pauli TaxID=166793 RepID=UPI0011C484A4|nr:hypothetical protein [Solirubrobacter pauli]